MPKKGRKQEIKLLYIIFSNILKNIRTLEYRDVTAKQIDFVSMTFYVRES